jgi:hypothetical protein
VSTRKFGGIISCLDLLGILFVTSQVAEVDCFFFHLIWLSSHSGLIDWKLSSVENKSVNRVCHTVLDVNNITNIKVVVM